MSPAQHYYAAAPVFITAVSRSLPVFLLLALVLAPAAGAAERPRHLWATVNMCDSAQSTDTFGVRASMPGTGRRREVMYMRFRAQYFSEFDNLWHNFEDRDAVDSGWLRVGSARFRRRQSGWIFPAFAVPPGQRLELRGHVRFEWRRGRRVVKRAATRTSGGRRPDIAEPRGFSAATCALTG